jgi:NAD(P)-dependent dehydrogenase (short-subunit alcohol dehydrogenase family)
MVDVDEAAGRRAADRLSDHGAVEFLTADVGDEDRVRSTVEAATSRFGGISALINNAGVADPDNGPVDRLPLADWERRLRTNLTGPFLCAKHAIPKLRESGGSIVNIASTRALQSEPDTEAYAATKGGLVALTHALAVSLGPEIRVNAVSPGWIDTRRRAGDGDEAEALTELDHAQHPVGRVGRPEDVAGTVAWLLSGDAAFVTGQNIIVDGGMTRKMIYAD